MNVLTLKQMVRLLKTVSFLAVKKISIIIDHHRRVRIQGTADKPHKCEKCGKGFSQNGNLQNHLRMHDRDCSYKRQQEHLKVHTADRPHKCEHYDKCFNRNDVLWGHLRIHTREKPFQCEYCQKIFIMSDYLSRYIVTHTGDKLFKCEQCEKNFSQMNNMKYHNRIHTGEKPFQCEFCKKNFTMKHHLKLSHQDTQVTSPSSVCCVERNLDKRAGILE